jgi:hypothetical protein
MAWDERDDFLSPAYFSAHVRGFALASDLSRNPGLPKCPPVVLVAATLKRRNRWVGEPLYAVVAGRGLAPSCQRPPPIFSRFKWVNAGRSVP